LRLTHQLDRAIILQTFSLRATFQPTHTTHSLRDISANLLRHSEVVTELLAEASRSWTACGDLIGPVKPIVIEVIERELLDDLPATRRMLQPFLDSGIRLALGDFGSGYSSYQYLADLPFSFLKIEGALIRRVTEPRTRTIVQGIQRTAADLVLSPSQSYVERNRLRISPARLASTGGRATTSANRCCCRNTLVRFAEAGL
jgi:EAL domain-containing protein (putative c-di-GMP-specific phosphodiesterase class I)